MPKIGVGNNNNLESAIKEILKSRSRSKIYLFLLKKNSAKTDEIIKGTRLHPSTVRETLSKMHYQKIISRKKLKNDSIGKNPYIYYPINPVNLIKKYTSEIENKLNKIANLTFEKRGDGSARRIKIKIQDRVEEI
jgi:predicted transcriptional regulator